MNETVLLVSLIAGFFAITMVALIGLVLTRRREQNRQQAQHITQDLNQLDAALHEAVTEINKMGSLVQKDIADKYQAVLFMYNLLEDKHKEMIAIAANLPEGEGLPPVLPLPVEAAPPTPPEEPTPGEPTPAEPTADAAPVSYLEALALRAETAETAYEPDPAVPPSDDALPPLRLANPRHAQVLDMHQAGQSVADISKALGIGQGETQLIINLAAQRNHDLAI